MKLHHKTRHAARAHKVYVRAQTPYQRLVASSMPDEAQQQTLAAHYAQTNPVRLLAQVNQALEQLWTLAIYPDQQRASVTPLTEATIAIRQHFLLTRYVALTPLPAMI
jgi:hypothetical protein